MVHTKVQSLHCDRSRSIHGDPNPPQQGMQHQARGYACIFGVCCGFFVLSAYSRYCLNKSQSITGIGADCEEDLSLRIIPAELNHLANCCACLFVESELNKFCESTYHYWRRDPFFIAGSCSRSYRETKQNKIGQLVQTRACNSSIVKNRHAQIQLGKSRLSSAWTRRKGAVQTRQYATTLSRMTSTL